jgi:hypothetical protein
LSGYVSMLSEYSHVQRFDNGNLICTADCLALAVCAEFDILMLQKLLQDEYEVPKQEVFICPVNL